MEDISSCPDSIRVLALVIEVSQAQSWAEDIRQRDGDGREFEQDQLDLRLDNVRRLLLSVGPHSSNEIAAASHAFSDALADNNDVPPEGPWPESDNLKQVIRRELRADLLPAPQDWRDWARRVDFLAGRSWIGRHARSCPAGWLPLLERAVSQAEHWMDRAILEKYQTSQIKEKFGTLRWYVASNEVLSVIVDYAELASEFTCLACGAEGKLRGDRTWILTLCDAHDKLDREGNIHALSRLAYPELQK
ncbi:hypothetical protein AAFN88_14910 [Pelagibius sp. CAU 1746]|uniref:hypothetical protein n=1 Tax=Pelagibius sp. CAU 1746 TaxID=3140370 RepID=UPI00325BA708